MLQTSDLGKDMLKFVYMQVTDKVVPQNERQPVGKRYLVVPVRCCLKGNNDGKE